MCLSIHAGLVDGYTMGVCLFPLNDKWVDVAIVCPVAPLFLFLSRQRLDEPFSHWQPPLKVIMP